MCCVSFCSYVNQAFFSYLLLSLLRTRHNIGSGARTPISTSFASESQLLVVDLRHYAFHLVDHLHRFVLVQLVYAVIVTLQRALYLRLTRLVHERDAVVLTVAVPL